MSFGDVIRALKTRADGWYNTLTGIGVDGKSRYEFARRGRLTDQALEDIYHEDGFAARIVDCVPTEALRRGLDVVVKDASVASVTKSKIEDLQASRKLLEAWTWGRLYGGALMLVGADDGQPPNVPIDYSRLRAVRFLSVVDKRYAQPATWYDEPGDALAPRFGTPRTYRVQRTGGGAAQEYAEWHSSRVIRFDGVLTSRRRQLENNGWSESVLQRIFDKLEKFNGSYEATSSLLQEASVGVYKVKDLVSMMSSDGEDAIKTRLAIMDRAKSVSRAILVDADGEDYQRIEVGALSGLPATLDHYMMLLSGVSGIPVTILYGRSPAGLNATGESDIRAFYSMIASEQTNELIPRATKLVQMILRSSEGPTGGREPDSWSVACPSLWEETPKEQREGRKLVADTDKVYLDAQVVTPEEIAVNRFRPEGWSEETSIETDLREASIEADRGTPTSPANATPATEQAETVTQIVSDVASRKIPRDTGVAMLVSVCGMTLEAAEVTMGEAGRSFFTTPDPASTAELDSLRETHAAATRSNTSLRSLLKRVLAKNRDGVLVKGSPVGAGSGGAISDQEVEAIMEALPPEVDGEAP